MVRVYIYSNLVQFACKESCESSMMPVNKEIALLNLMLRSADNRRKTIQK